VDLPEPGGAQIARSGQSRRLRDPSFCAVPALSAGGDSRALTSRSAGLADLDFDTRRLVVPCLTYPDAVLVQLPALSAVS
jgi:hypothetical protein